MKIEKRLRLNTWISLIVVMLMMLSLALSFWEIDRAARNKNLVEEMRKTALERITLRDDYLLYREERASIQWVAKSATLRGLMETASERFTATKDKALLQEARKNFDMSFSVFSAIMEKHKRGERLASRKLVFDEAESRLIGQVFLKAYALMDSIGRLYESTERAAQQARNQGAAFVIFFVVGGGMAIVFNTVLTRRIVVQRMTALHEGVEIIGGGNLDYRIAAEGDDELADLASESNQMAASLKESYTSVENTLQEAEVTNRTRPVGSRQQGTGGLQLFRLSRSACAPPEH